MNDYDVEMPMTIYAGMYVRDIHAQTPEEAVEKAHQQIRQNGIDMMFVWVNDSEIHDGDAIPRLVKSNIQPKPDIEE